MSNRSENVSTVMDVVARTVARLPAKTLAALAEHPNAITTALTTAANVIDNRDEHPEQDAISNSFGEDYVSASESAQRLARITRKTQVEDTLSSDEVALLLGLKGRASVIQRLRDGRLIGIEGERRGVRFPREQFDPHGVLWPGVTEIRALFPDAFAAWHWLTTPSSALEGHLPLERLQSGQSESVIAVAQAERQGDFM